ncbi:MAG: CHAT domain-containing protein, partial [Planctomycetaceae bacterium]|nr:CHAT domain-containing protein [Planctomycetaceae bacterium]
QQRSQTSGGEQERSTSSEQLFLPFEMMARWQTELGDFAAAFAALERGRARSLVDQLHTQGIDLLADVPLDQARELRLRDSAAKQQVASVEKQLELLAGDASLAPPQQAERESQLLRELQEAQEEAVAVYREMRNLSPAYRLAVSRDFRPWALDDLQAWVSAQRALLLEYAIGTHSSHVVMIPPEGAARVEKLVVPDDLAAALHVEPGELTAEKLAAIWQVGDKDLVARVAEPQLAEAAAERLALLWRLLVPSAAREALVDSTQLERLIVIPDGQLNALPFEALIVEPGTEAKYLLDVAPPISYAASATVLVNLAQRTLKATPSAQPLLTVADAVYGAAAGEAGESSLVPTARSRYWDGAGPLAALPFTATESSWVVKNFKTEGIPAAGLRGALATEANVRANVAGREFLHFACHGLVDQRYGNFFGALALTPGRRGGPEDDGYLTLPEIYALPLAGCELSILSACQTNVGPQQRGEGLFGLSRGFLVAGSRRVVASNWLVDDEAAASLVSYFTAGLAQDKKKGSAVDYARALHTAKRWVRAQPKWQSPYYWGTFVLVGPN